MAFVKTEPGTGESGNPGGANLGVMGSNSEFFVPPMRRHHCCCGKKWNLLLPGMQPFPYCCSLTCALSTQLGEAFGRANRGMTENLLYMITNRLSRGAIVTIDRTGVLPKVATARLPDQSYPGGNEPGNWHLGNWAQFPMHPPPNGGQAQGLGSQGQLNVVYRGGNPHQGPSDSGVGGRQVPGLVGQQPLFQRPEGNQRSHDVKYSDIRLWM